MSQSSIKLTYKTSVPCHSHYVIVMGGLFTIKQRREVVFAARRNNSSNLSHCDEYQEESQLLGTKPECPPPRDFPTLLTCDKRAVWSMTCCVSMLSAYSGVLPLSLLDKSTSKCRFRSLNVGQKWKPDGILDRPIYWTWRTEWGNIPLASFSSRAVGNHIPLASFSSRAVGI